MSLENILLALRHSINRNLSELDEKVLEEDKDVQNTLTTFFAEQQVRPELTSLIRSQSLMYEYLQLSLEEREEMEGFRQNYPDYLNGEGKDLKNRSVYLSYSKKALSVVKKQRYVEQLLKMFDFYLKNRKEGEIFNSNYLQINRKIKKQFGSFGINLSSNINRNLKEEGGLNYVKNIASEINPKIKKYTTFIEVIKIDGKNQLLRMFDSYLQHRKEGEIFNKYYLNRQFRGVVKRLRENAKNNLNTENGIRFFIEIAAQERPEILNHWTYVNIPREYKLDAIIGRLIRMFDFYLENRKEGEKFNVNYICRNHQFLEHFGKSGRNLYKIARKRFHKNGGINYFIHLTAQERPEVWKYWNYDKQKALTRKRGHSN